MAVNERDPRDPQLERLYRGAAREEPPAHLDAAIRAAARREVGAGPRSLAARLRRWHVPVSIAAVVLVSASLVILVTEEGGERLDEIRIPPMSAPPAKSAAEPAATPPVALLEKAERRQAESPAPAAPASKPFVASPPAPAQERAAVPGVSDPALARRMESDSPGPVARRSAEPAADTLEAKPLARAILAKPAAADRPPIWQGLENEPPEKWVPRIEELMREGRKAEADEMRAEFRRRFPDHPFGQASK
jgi:hypothetical protein